MIMGVEPTTAEGLPPCSTVELDHTVSTASRAAAYARPILKGRRTGQGSRACAAAVPLGGEFFGKCLPGEIRTPGLGVRSAAIFR